MGTTPEDQLPAVAQSVPTAPVQVTAKMGVAVKAGPAGAQHGVHDSAGRAVQPARDALPGPGPGHRLAHAGGQNDYRSILLLNHERENNREKRLAGIELAKQQGKYLGRPAGRDAEKMTKVARALGRGLSVAKIVALTGISRASVTRYHHELRVGG